MREEKREDIKFLVLTEKDRKLLMSIDRSLNGIKKGKIKNIESVIQELKKHK